MDNLDTIRAIIDDLALPRSYIHADGALHGMILPFVDDPQPFAFDSGIDSIAISGHKMIGSPIPCGVVVTKKEYTAQIWQGNRVCRRAGHNAARLAQRDYPDDNLVRADQARHGRIPRDGGEDAGHRRIRRSAVQRERDSRLARQEQPYCGLPAAFLSMCCSRWQLAPLGDIAHLITMQHVTREMIDEVIADCLQWPPVE